ncbi:hypothetical protein [Demequina sp.]|uniref:hypothetical protein n=1 Tax=Demequina sp. TaxID=2050685 RepID=UPI0025C6F153|nr:hypothetical protein [Demequina sp.]
MAKCRGCNAEIEFAYNPDTGKRVPINPPSPADKKDPRASWAIWDNPAGGWYARPITVKEPFNFHEEHMAINHLSVCPRPHARPRRGRDRVRAY